MSRLNSVLRRATPIGCLAAAFLLAGCPKPTPPEANFYGSRIAGYDPVTVYFADTSVPGSEDITSWSWSFGDGATSFLQNPSHVYTTPGVYSVSLTVTAGAGSDTRTETDYITVNDADVDALIIHRYPDTQEEAEQLAEVLDSRGLASRIFFRGTYSNLTELDLSRPGMIILCSDAYTFDPAELSSLQDSGKGILATGGGYILLGDLGLHIDNAIGGYGSTLMVALATHSIFTTPNDLGVVDGEEVDLFLTGTKPYAHGIYLEEIPDTADVTVLAYSPGGTSYARLVMEDDIYIVWGFTGEFDRLSVPGLDLLENCVRYLLD